MPLTDILTTYGFEEGTLDLIEPQQLSRAGDGTIYGDAVDEPHWLGRFATEPLLHVDATTLEAKMRSLRGVLGTLLVHDLRRPFPGSSLDGSLNDANVKIQSVNGSDARLIALKGLPAGYIIRVGDFLGFVFSSTHYALHQVVAGATANGSGVTAEFEVVPPLQPGATANTAVALNRAPCEAVIEPRSLQLSRFNAERSRVAFRTVQVL